MPEEIVATDDLGTSRARERAIAARARSEELRHEWERLTITYRRTLGERLAARTARLDAGQGTPADRDRIDKLSRIVGRDPAIEEAKTVLADRYGITAGEAFRLLSEISQRKNRKLREVAHAVLASSALVAELRTSSD